MKIFRAYCLLIGFLLWVAGLIALVAGNKDLFHTLGMIAISCFIVSAVLNPQGWLRSWFKGKRAG